MSRCRHCAPVPAEVRQAAGLLEGRWTISILWASYEGASRFNEFKQAVGEIPPRTLAQRLVELEEAGVLERRVVDARPPRVEYTLTPEGLRLQAVVDALVRFAASRTPPLYLERASADTC
jgi:DNA-binding HxlR family transcriptional regulator